MRLNEFDYDLPAELIAQEPTKTRDASRLMIVHPTRVDHSSMRELPSIVPEGSLIVVNDTRVLRARILGSRVPHGGRCEVFLLEKLAAEHTWKAMGRASKPLRPGTRVVAGDLVVEFGDRMDDGLFQVRLSSSNPAVTVEQATDASARIPLPPYIKRDTCADDEERYQTVYARHLGAVAAPTAGLHLTHDLLEALKQRGCEIEACTLHVGLGTFQPVTADDLNDHRMHAEAFEVSSELAQAIARARARGAPVVAIGTTVVRALESAACAHPGEVGLVRPCREQTRMLIQPGYRFRVVDHLLTNFHLPKSTLLALVSAFSGLACIRDAYRAAVLARYRFFSYGDAMFLTRAQTGTEP